MSKYSFACAALAAVCLLTSNASAQCSTCAVPQVAYSPVVVNTFTTNDGWYLGKYVGRFGRRVFGTAPAQVHMVGFPTTTFASCQTCGTSPCCCPQTSFRPVVMQPVSQCNTCCFAPACTSCSYTPSCSTCNSCGTCDTCSGVTQTSYESTISSSCPTCNTSTSYPASSDSTQPSLPSSSPAPPQTFREKAPVDQLDPIPAEESSLDDQNAGLDAPMLLDPNDKLTKRPTAPVWTAVYKKPATIQSISSAGRATSANKKNIGWTSGR